MEYKRIILKLSGELFQEKGDLSIDLKKVDVVAQEIKKAMKQFEMGVVIGAGNIWRGRHDVQKMIGETTGHWMGMMATFVNALALKGTLEKNNIKAHIVAPFFVPGVTEKASRAQMRAWLKKKHIIIFAAGTGRPGPSTDSVTVTRAREIEADAVLKGTKVDGVYDKDPEKNKSAKRFGTLSYNEYIKRKLGVMDLQAIKDAKKAKIPVVVFKWKMGALKNVKGTEIN